LPAWACSVSSLLPPFKSHLSLTERTGRVIPLIEKLLGPMVDRVLLTKGIRGVDSESRALLLAAF
ncbi:hypothetical protein, partial [Bradyrhizobium sp. GM2.2]|uniref:hypothetical protein n=1 Tax=Bradyrhizobium sp. GM2.2 TaxID=3156358 RepID=UPI003393BC10